MQKYDEKTSLPVSEKSLSQIIQREAGDKNSIRTTFSLSKEGIQATEELRRQSGITLKKLVDILCKGVPIQGDFELKEGKEIPLIHGVIKIAKTMDIDKSRYSIRKTMAISARAQKVLNNISKSYNIPRDVLIDEGFTFMQSILKKRAEEFQEKHQKVLKIIGSFWSEGEKIERDLKELLDQDDPILERFGLIIMAIMNLHLAIDNELKHGTPIVSDDMSQSGASLQIEGGSYEAYQTCETKTAPKGIV
jgi:hypothetical protein